MREVTLYSDGTPVMTIGSDDVTYDMLDGIDGVVVKGFDDWDLCDAALGGFDEDVMTLLKRLGDVPAEDENKVKCAFDYYTEITCALDHYKSVSTYAMETPEEAVCAHIHEVAGIDFEDLPDTIKRNLDFEGVQHDLDMRYCPEAECYYTLTQIGTLRA